MQTQTFIKHTKNKALEHRIILDYFILKRLFLNFAQQKNFEIETVFFCNDPLHKLRSNIGITKCTN
ncbi:hypothetical protein BLOT_009252 [Blomia tropicalis]|nr:hypothetical protein BLOT_009252 [Blomia tropicalis]